MPRVVDPNAIDIVPFEAGQVLDAGRLERMRQDQQGQDLSAESGGVVHSSGGTTFRQPGPVEHWAEITAGTNPYAWKKKVPISGGGWQDGYGTGNQAREVNGHAGVPAGTIVWLRRDGGLNQHHFQYSACPS